MTYIKEKIGKSIKDIYQYFYKSKTGPNDTKLCLLLQKILRLCSYIEGTTELNVMNRVSLDMVQIVSFLFSNEDRKVLNEKVAKFLKLDYRYIYENVLENKTTNVENVRSEEALRYFSSRDKLIERFNEVFNDLGRGSVINLDALLRLKLARSKREIGYELQHQLQKSFNEYTKDESKDDLYKRIDDKKNYIQNQFGKIRTFHNHLRNSFVAKFEDLKAENYPLEYANYSMMNGNRSGMMNSNSSAMHYSRIYESHNKPLNKDDLDFHDELKKIDYDNSKANIEKLIDKERPQICMDPEVSRVYQDICSSVFSTQKIGHLQLTLSNLDYCISFERLVYAIVNVYHSINSIFRDVDDYKRSEKDYLKSVSGKI